MIILDRIGKSWTTVDVLTYVLTQMASLWKRENSKYWTACFTDINGHRKKRSTEETDRRKAQKIADTYEDASRRRRTASQVRKVIAEVTREITGDDLAIVSLREFTDRWLKRKRGSIAVSSYKSYRDCVIAFVDFMEAKADRDIGEITRDDITAFRDSEATRVSASTANKALKRVRMLFREAESDSLIPEDPARHVGTAVRDKETTERKPFTIPQIEKILSVADNEWRSIVKFALYTGQRLGDLAALTWENIDLKKGEIHLVTIKTGREQRLVMAAPLIAHIKSLPVANSISAPLHPKAKQILDEQEGRVGSLSRQFGEILAEADLRVKRNHRSRGKGRTGRREMNSLTFHSFRRTATTLLHELGISPSVAQALIGHDSKEVHEGYISIGRKALADAAEKFPTLEG